MTPSLHEIDGYGVVLPLVQNYYPVEDNGAGGFCWGFKYASGVFEYFQHAERQDAETQRQQFVFALDSWHTRLTRVT